MGFDPDYKAWSKLWRGGEPPLSRIKKLILFARANSCGIDRLEEKIRAACSELSSTSVAPPASGLESRDLPREMDNYEMQFASLNRSLVQAKKCGDLPTQRDVWDRMAIEHQNHGEWAEGPKRPDSNGSPADKDTRPRLSRPSQGAPRMGHRGMPQPRRSSDHAARNPLNAAPRPVACDV